jgi:4-hydroxy-tetrahydrodipicolinate synthase
MFQGSIAALVTPMNERGQVDLPALRRLIDFHLENQTDALVIAGTTGEGATLDGEELRELLTTAIRHVDGRMPVIAGTGSPDTGKSIRLTSLAAGCGADAALVVTPYYNRPTQRGLEAHFAAIADATDIPIILYNVPSRTAVDLRPETVERLAVRDDIVAIKEAVADMDRVGELLARCGDKLTVLSGDDKTCMRAMLQGAAGVVSVAANVAPRQMRKLSEAAARGDERAAGAVNSALGELFRVLTLESNPIPVKWSVARMGLIGTGIRLPLLPLSEAYRPEIEKCLRSLGTLDEETREHGFEHA